MILGASGVANIGSISWRDALLFSGIGLLYAYVVALIPSIAYATVMEFVARRCGIEPGSRRAMWLSAGLGCIVGTLPLLNPDAWREWRFLIPISAVGFVVGLVVEWLIGQIKERCRDNPQTKSWAALCGHD